MTIIEALLDQCSGIIPKPINLFVVITTCHAMSQITQEGFYYQYHMDWGVKCWVRGRYMYVCNVQ